MIPVSKTLYHWLFARGILLCKGERTFLQHFRSISYQHPTDSIIAEPAEQFLDSIKSVPPYPDISHPTLVVVGKEESGYAHSKIFRTTGSKNSPMLNLLSWTELVCLRGRVNWQWSKKCCSNFLCGNSLQITRYHVKVWMPIVKRFCRKNFLETDKLN